MIEKMRKKIPEIAVLLVCLAVLCGFVSAKEGFHMDELLSFELANAKFNPWIVPTQPQGRLAKFVEQEIDGENAGETLQNLWGVIADVVQNRAGSRLLSYTADVYEEPVWITSQQFTDYITVDGSDAFNYLSVYFNVKDDNHPPLHFMLLHTVSSLFWGKAEPWMGCLINLAAVLGILILLMKSGRLLAEAYGMEERARWVGILAALLYGLSAGAVATVLLIRMYGMVTFFCVWYFYLILKKWREGSFDRKNAWLILAALFGFWTQYFFLFYCILLAAVTAVFLLRDKRLRELFCFVRSMVIAAVIGVAVFPFAVSDVFSSGRGVEALGNLSEGFSGYGERLGAFLTILKDRTLSPYFWGMLLILVVVFFARKRTAAGEKNCGENLASAGQPTGDMTRKEAGDRTALCWMLFFPAAGYFLLAARMSPYLVDRYVMPAFPFVILSGTFLLALLIRKQGVKPAAAVCALALVLQIFSLCQYDGSYLYKGYAAQEKLAEDHADYSCICVYAGVGYYENLKEFTIYPETLLLTQEELENRQDRESIAEKDRICVLIKYGVDEEAVLSVLTEEYGFELEDGGWLDEGPYTDTICFMRKGN